jgi:hypothetical protein
MKSWQTQTGFSNSLDLTNILIWCSGRGPRPRIRNASSRRGKGSLQGNFKSGELQPVLVTVGFAFSRVGEEGS